MRIFTTEFTGSRSCYLIVDTDLLWILVVALGGDVGCLSRLYLS